jgi:WD40 repeat protein
VSGTINSVVFRRDGSRVIMALDNGTVEVWDPRQRSRPTLILTGHTGYVNDAESSPDGRRIVTAGGDGTTRVWDAQTGAALTVFYGQPGATLSASFSPDGRHVISASDGGTVKEWTCDLCVSTDRLLGLARQRSTRPLTSVERRLYLESS